MEVFLKIVLVFIAPILVTALVFRKDPELPEVLPFSFIPGVGMLIAVLSLIVFVSRIFKSKGKCILGHKFLHVHDTESAKWANGRIPMRVSVGGSDQYICTTCAEKKTISWKAF